MKQQFQPFVEERDPIIHNGKLEIDRTSRNIQP